MKAKFKYLETEITMQINQEEKAEDICNKYAFKANLNMNDYDYKYGEKTINLEEPLIEQLELPENQEEIEITVINKKPIVEININGNDEKEEIKEGHSFEDTVNSIFRRLQLPLNKFGLLYGGQLIGENDRRKSFRHIANRIDRERNRMKILAVDNNEPLNENENQNNTKKINQNTENLNDDIANAEQIVFLLMNSSKFFIKLYLFLLVQFILISILTFLGFQYDFDDVFSNTSNAFWWTICVVSIFILIASAIPFCLAEKPKGGCCAYFLWFIYIPVITIYCYLLKRHEGVDIIEGFYIIYQLIIFSLDFLLVIITNAIFKRYRGWVHLLILSPINVLTIYIMAGPLSDNYDNLKMSHEGFVNICIISSVMIVFIIIFNGPIISLNQEDNETGGALIGAISFISVPFVFALLFIALFAIIGFFLGLIALLVGILFAVIAIFIVVYTFALLFNGLL